MKVQKFLVTIILTISLIHQPAKSQDVDPALLVGGVSCGAVLLGFYAAHLYHLKHGYFPKGLRREFKKIGILKAPIKWVMSYPIRGDLGGDVTYILGFPILDEKSPKSLKVSYTFYTNREVTKVLSLRVTVKEEGKAGLRNQQLYLLYNYMQDKINELSLSQEEVQSLSKAKPRSEIFVSKESFSNEKDFHSIVRSIVRYQFTD